MNANANQIRVYLTRYISSYRSEYERFSSPRPRGGGYPAIPVSPYLYSKQITCFVARNGVAIADFSWEPEYHWEIAGGPTLLVDYPQSRTPAEVVALLKEQGLWGKPIGIYRIVSQNELPEDIWAGKLDDVAETIEQSVGETTVIIRSYDVD